MTLWIVAEFRQVHFRYQMRPLQTVLDGMSFRIPEGTVCALVGRSGGGKSTMIHLMLRFYDPTEGSIAIGGVDLRDLHLPSVHRRIGVVSQETQLFNATIRENIAYGAPDGYTEEELVAATRAAQALDFIHSFEDGFATRVGERGQRLSGGQKQRIAIARCLLRRPRLLLLDEATSALDTESEAAVQKALDEMIWERGGYTVLLVAHRLSTVVNSQTIVVVDKGKAAEIGSHEGLLAQDGAYASLVAHQLLKQREQLDQDTQAGTSGAASGAAPPGGRGRGGGRG